jgi:hypothetical protein
MWNHACESVKGEAFQVKEGIRKDFLYRSFVDIDKEKLSF